MFASRIAALGFGLAFAVLLILVRMAGGLEFLELRVYDRLLMSQSPATSSPPITLIVADEQDIARFGWPFSDALLADVLTPLLAGKPRVIGLDIYRDKPLPPGDDRFAALLAQRPEIIAVFRLGEGLEPGVPAHPAVAETDRKGLADMVVDRDGTLRRGLLYLGDAQGVFPTLALRLAFAYLEPQGITPHADPTQPNWLQLGQTVFQPLRGDEGGYAAFDPGGYQFFLDFADRKARFPVYRFSDVLDGRLPKHALNDRMVIVGINALSVKDFFYTPENTSDATDKGHSAGSLVQGQLAAQLIRFALGESQPRRVLAPAEENLLILLTGLASALLGLRIRRYGVLAALLLVGGAAGIVLTQSAFDRGLWLPAAPALLAWFGAAILTSAHISSQEKRERMLYRQSLMAYLSPPVVDRILAGELRPELGGTRTEITVLFADIRGYTTLSEGMSPEGIITFLNTYFGRVVEDIHAHGGTVVSFMGDGIMAVFGAPAPLPNAPQAAFDASLAMLRSVEQLNLARSTAGEAPIRIGIGLNHGPCVVGHVGAQNRHEYTAIGDATNVASRLEGLTKEAGCPIVCSASVAERIDSAYRLLSLGAMPIKGHTPVEVFGFDPQGSRSDR